MQEGRRVARLKSAGGMQYVVEYSEAASSVRGEKGEIILGSDVMFTSIHNTI
jgi:hypothetical protein